MPAPDTTPTPVTPPSNPTAPKEDLSKFIRTFAKDAAALGAPGAPTPATPQKPVAPVVPPTPPQPVGESADGVQFDATKETFFERSTPTREDSYAPVAVESRAELDSYVNKNGTPPTPSPAGESREATLARLKAKLNTSVPVPPQPVPPAPTAAPTPSPVQAPSFVSAPQPVVNALPPLYREPIEPVPERAPLPPRTQLPTPPPPFKVDAPVSFHSYGTDFTDRVDSKSASAFSVLAAEQDVAPSSRPTPTKSRTSVVPILAGVVLIVLAGAGSYVAYRYIGARTAVPVITLQAPSLIVADEYKKISGTGPDLMRALAIVANEMLINGNAMVTYIEQPATGDPSVIAGSPAPGGVLIKALSLPAPDLLLRNITDASTVGVIREGGDTRAFFVLKVSSYERTFAGMLTWEPLMERDLGLLYPLYASAPMSAASVDLNTASTTASSTPVALPDTPTASSRGRFEDAIVANKDVRILRDTSGRALMLYGYADKETLIIARNEASFAALITRLKPAP